MSGPTRHAIGACDDTMAAAGVRAIDYLTATGPTVRGWLDTCTFHSNAFEVVLASKLTHYIL